MRVAGDQRFVVRKRHSWNILEQVVAVAYQISLETNCVEVSFVIKLHDRGPATFLQKQLAALDMVLNTPLNRKLSTYYYNIDVCEDPNDYRSSRPEVFCKKGVLRNFAKFTGKHLYQSLWYRSFPVNFVKFLKTPFFIEHLWWLLLYLVLNGQHR